MNAAEITDKLGLHSLRQRAWVRLLASQVINRIKLTAFNSIFNPPVPPLAMASMKAWSG
jgi:hypothetical protein